MVNFEAMMTMREVVFYDVSTEPHTEVHEAVLERASMFLGDRHQLSAEGWRGSIFC